MHVSEAASDGLTTDEDDDNTYASDAFELDDIGEHPRPPFSRPQQPPAQGA